MADEKWSWQEKGTAWYGVGIYHVTLTVPSRKPLLGTLVIPDNDPAQAKIERTELGNALVDKLLAHPSFYPEIRILQFCLMPDHLHTILHVTRPMNTSIRSVVRSLWQGAKKLGKAYTMSLAPESDSGTNNKDINNTGTDTGTNNKDINKGTNTGTNTGTDNKNINTGTDTGTNTGTDNKNINTGTDTGTNNKDINTGTGTGTNTGTNNKEEQSYPFPIFTERPFIRVLTHRGQLQTMYDYIRMNPQRLATKHLMPEYFRVQEGIVIAGQTYRGVGNVELLQRAQYMPVHVRSIWGEKAEKYGEDKPLRDYMNGCVLAARKGIVMVSPFISKYEQMVMAELLKEGLPFIYITDNGFRDYYKPQKDLFDAVARKNELIRKPSE